VRSLTIRDDHTTIAVQQYLDELAEGSSSEPVIRALLERAAGRLWQLCAALLHRGYPRLTRPPLNLQADEMLSAVVERLMKALRETRPTNVRQFFGLASQHMRWELNDMARRLDTQPGVVELADELAAAPVSSELGLTPNARRIFEAIDELPDDEREVFELVHIQGLSQAETARVLEISPMTVMRRLNRGLQTLAAKLPDLSPEFDEPDGNE
jgi:RNA polymerase sigma-70 factor (ECF subfamily)